MVSILGDYYYEFPSKMPLKKRLKDMLEDSVNERYYLSETAVKGCLNTTFNHSRLGASTESKDGVMPTLCASDYKDPKLVVEDARLMQVAQLTDKKYNEMTGRVYSDEGLCPTIRTMQGGCLEPKVADENIAGKDVLPYRIRKLTPKECWRLMGFTDEDIDKAVAVGMSNAQLYKQAGNSIVVQVLEGIFGEML
jgi:DNA (cytosine-5)-methyltransferase 1